MLEAGKSPSPVGSPSLTPAANPPSTEELSDARLYDSVTGEKPVPPEHWPPNVYVDCWKRISWLPPEWGQGIKRTASGRSGGVYVSPVGKMYYHKHDIEKQEGVDWSKNDFPPMDGLSRQVYWEDLYGIEKENKLESKLKVPDHWPEGTVPDPKKRMPWLPADFGQGYKKTNNGLPLVCFIGPDGGRYFHKSKLEEVYFNKEKLPDINLMLNGRGDALDEQALLQLAKGKVSRGRWRLGSGPDPTESSSSAQGTAPQRRSKKARLSTEGADSAIISPQDQDQHCSLVVASVPMEDIPLKVEAEISASVDMSELRKSSEQIRKLLVARGFNQDVDLLTVFMSRPPATSQQAPFSSLEGMYHQLASLSSDERPYFQKVAQVPHVVSGIACKRIFLFWSRVGNCWRFAGSTDDEQSSQAGALAYCDDDQPHPAAVQKPWTVSKKDASNKFNNIKE